MRKATHFSFFCVLPYLCYLILCYALIACAQQQPLTGGEKDTIPPQLNRELSTPNYQTNFTKQNIEFVFDEYIQLQDIVKQLVISPPLERLPKVSVKLKKLIFEFPEGETLKDGVTYSINFGEAVRDLTEGNAVPNFKYTFSTGPYIDSLKVEGTIIDAISGDAVKDVLYMLYQNLNDTVVRTEKPFYFGKSDKNGKFVIENVKAGIYKGFALEDQDLNYLYNIPKERIGFSEDRIVVSDTSTLAIKVGIFEPYYLVSKPKFNISDYGLAELIFERNPFDVEVELENIDQVHFIETIDDTIKIWYHSPDTMNWQIFVHRDTLTDTLLVKNMPKNISQKSLNLTNSIKDAELNPLKSIKLDFNHPIQSIDTSLILVQEDSIIITSPPAKDSLEIVSDTTTPPPIFLKNIDAAFLIDSTQQRTISVNYSWKENYRYTLRLLPEAIIDIYDLTNTDTITLSYSIKEKKDFGNIKLSITEMDTSKAYRFELLYNNDIIEYFSVRGLAAYNRVFTGLVPGSYSIKMVEDLNDNGRWDSGNYDKKRQPEKISITKLEELKANWDIEANIIVGF